MNPLSTPVRNTSTVSPVRVGDVPHRQGKGKKKVVKRARSATEIKKRSRRGKDPKTGGLRHDRMASEALRKRQTTSDGGAPTKKGKTGKEKKKRTLAEEEQEDSDFAEEPPVEFKKNSQRKQQRRITFRDDIADEEYADEEVDMPTEGVRLTKLPSVASSAT